MKTRGRSRRSAVYVAVLSSSPVLTKPQALYPTAVVWKRLEHQHIVPLLGITPTPLQFISKWMPGGDLTGYITNHPDADRLCLVGTFPTASRDILTPLPAI